MTEKQSEYTLSERGAPDPSTLVTIICHLMTCYAMRPSGLLASSIERHMDLLLNSRAGDELGDWITTFEQLHTQWHAISERHARIANRNETAQAGPSSTH
jgi:hypothetical protein